MSRLGAVSAILLSLVAAGGALITGCPRPRAASITPPPPPVALPDRRMVSEGFVGTSACQPCHPGEHKAHGTSRHARALTAIGPGMPANLVPRVGALDDSDAVITASRGGYALSVPGEDGSLPLDLAFGSGKAGITYVAAMGDELLEVHRSWHPGTGRWYGTPGHERMPAANIGMMYKTDQAKTCILCHTTALPDRGLIPPKAMMGIGCEGCHGPGADHVRSMQSASPGALAIRKLKGAKPELVNGVCGQCHRSRESIAEGNSEADQTNRFQMVGMLKSRCYLESKPTMTCVTCHAPHTDAPKEAAPYEAACKTCHVAPKTTCPVNKASGCIGCHMPDKPVFSNGSWPALMSDHWIRKRPR